MAEMLYQMAGRGAALVCLLCAVCAANQAVVSSFAEFSEAFQNSSITGIAISGAGIEYPCSSTFLRRAQGALAVSGSSFKPANAEDSCFLELQMEGKGMVSVSDVSFHGNFTFSLPSGLLSNCSFWGAAGSRALSIGQRSSISIVNTTFSSGDGCLSVSNCSTVSISNSTFQQCSSALDGGAILVKGSLIELSVAQTHFENSVSGGDGGALFISASDSFVAVNDSSFLGCSARRGGCIAFENSRNITVSFWGGNIHCGVQSPIPELGGAVYATKVDSSTLEFRGFDVSFCDATNASAGMRMDRFVATSVILRKSHLFSLGESTAPAIGGALSAQFWSKGSSLLLSAVNISRTTATQFGGGLSLQNFHASSVVVENSSLSRIGQGKWAPEYGGAIYVWIFEVGSFLTVRTVDISHCDCSGFGAGLSLNQFSASHALIVVSFFTLLGMGIKPPPERGGSLYAFAFEDGSSLKLHSVTVSDAFAFQYGAGIHLSDFSGSTAEIFNCTLERLGLADSILSGGVPVSGGGLYCYGFKSAASLLLSSVLIDSSDALRLGSGVYLEHFSTVDIQIVNSNFTNLGLGLKSGLPSLYGAIFAVSISDSSLSLRSVIISHCEAQISGVGVGLQTLSSTSFFVSNSTFDNLGQLQTPSLGAAISVETAVDGSRLNISYSTFRNCAASSTNGVVHFHDVKSSPIALSNLVIRIPHDQSAGLALSASSVDLPTKTGLIMHSCRIECDSGDCSNGGISLQSSDSNAEFVGTDFQSILSHEWGGAIFVDACEISQQVGTVLDFRGADYVTLANMQVTGRRGLSLQTIQNLTLFNFSGAFQTTLTRGACLTLSSVKYLLVLNSTFRDSSQTGSCIGCGGGAIALEGVTGRFENVIFRNLSADGVGGAVIVGGQSNVTFTNAFFSNCTARRNGGAIHVDGGTAIIENSHFEDCESLVGDGGGISAYEASVSLSNVDATRQHGGRGGFFSAVGCLSLALHDVTASQCHARSSGGFLSCQTVESIDMARVAASSCTAASGGSISLDSFMAGSAVQLEEVEFSNISATDTGGCVQLYRSSCTLKNSVLRNCSAASSGGAIQLQSSSSLSGKNLTIQSSTSASGGAVYSTGGSVLSFRNSTVTGNHATQDGGGLAVFDGKVDEFGSIFELNSASCLGGSIFLSEFSSIVLDTTHMMNELAAVNGGGVYLCQGSTANVLRSVFSRCQAGQSGGAFFLAEDRQSSVLHVTNSQFSGNHASEMGGAVALMDQASTLTFNESCVFSKNSAATGGAVYFNSLQVPSGLKQSQHHDNAASSEGNFYASGPVALEIEPSRFVVRSNAAFSVEVSLLDYSGDVVRGANATCVRISGETGDPVEIVGGSGSFVKGVADVPSIMLKKRPGTSGNVIVTVEAYNLVATVPYTLRNCVAGEITKSNECIECEYGTYALSTSDPSCRSCPEGGVCVNGSQVLPKWGYWKMNGTLGVCDVDESCSLPLCSLDDACFGVRSLWVNASFDAISPAIHSFAVVSGYSTTVAGAARVGDSVLLAETYWTRLAGLNCSDQICRMFLESSEWPMLGADTVEAQLFVTNRTCHRGYQGNLCSECEYGYGRTSGTECGRCEGALETFLLSVAFVIVAVAVVGWMTWSTLKNALKEGSQLVSIAKVVWTYLQLVGVCASLPMSWPSIIIGLFRVQNTASSVDSRQFVSLDCLLLRLGGGGTVPIVWHAILLLLTPIALILIAGLVWRFIDSCKSRKTFEAQFHSSALSGVSKLDKFFVTVITILFLLYPSLCNNSFALFPCKDLSTGMRFMSFDLSTSCSSSAYNLAVAVGVAGVLVYAFGIPAVSFFLVWRKRRLLHTVYARNSVGFLYIGYTAACYYFESIVMLKKMIFGGIVLMSHWLGGEVSGALLLLLLFVAYFLHVELKPFEDAAVDRLERLSSLGLILCLVSGLLFSSGRLSSGMQVLTMAGLVLVNLVFLCTAVLLAVPYLRPLHLKTHKEVSIVRLPIREETLNPVGQTGGGK